ncbi:MAG: APC family permease [Methanomassiliicoccales archaeon]|nr:APC family permease [Methanomassiliicoccales archaeon]
MEGKVDLRRKLNTFDVTNLVVGAIIGADIYVATGLGANLVGPSSLLIWVLAGVIAIVIALAFAHCVMILPRVGGPYAYVREVSSPFGGFIVGWSLLLAEWFSLAVFPVAFVQYFSALVPGVAGPYGVVIKGAFIMIVIVTNVIGIKAAGRFNDGLTLIKLSPLLLIILGGIAFLIAQPSIGSSNFSPFFKGDVFAFGQALVLIFWAYAGFELSTLPADEIERPERTIPKAIVIGMTVVVAFYFLTNLVVMGSVSQVTLSSSASPLIESASSIFGQVRPLSSIVMLVVGVGALLSILGADESGTIGTSRLAYAMSIDGLMPRVFSRSHSRFKTPYLGLIILCSTAFVASLFGGLVSLINASVFLLAFVYFLTCLSALLLPRKHPGSSKGIRFKIAIPVLGMIFSAVLMLLVEPMLIFTSLVLLTAGIPIYIWLTPKKELHELRIAHLSREAILRRTYAQRKRFLALPLNRLIRLIYRSTGTSSAWTPGDKEESKNEGRAR